MLRGTGHLLALRGDPGGYDVTVVSREPGPVVCHSGLQVVATAAMPERGPIGTEQGRAEVMARLHAFAEAAAQLVR